MAANWLGNATHREVLPGIALVPVGQLLPGDGAVAVLGDVNAEEAVAEVPHTEGPDGREANVDTDDEVAEQDPGGDEVLVRAPGRLLHDVGVAGVEAQGGRGGAIGDEVHPEELHGDQALGKVQGGCEEDRRDLSDVGRDHVADEGLSIEQRRHHHTSIIVSCSKRRCIRFFEEPFFGRRKRKQGKGSMHV